MNKLFKNLSCFKSMFSKLIAGFIIVIAIISSFHLVTNYIYTRNMEREITDIASEKFSNTVNEFERYFNEIQSKLLMDFYMEFFQYLKSPKSLDYRDRVMIEKIKKHMVTHSYIQDFVVLINDFDYILNSEGTYNKKSYFEIFNKNSVYTEKFWNGEMKKDFIYKIYPAKLFEVYTGIRTYRKQDSMPIVLKGAKDSDYILIAFIDIKSFLNDIGISDSEGFYIFDSSKELIFPAKDKANEDNLSLIKGRDNIPRYSKSDNCYIFTKKSAKNSLIYCQFYPNTAVVRQIMETNRILTLIILLSIIISIGLSVYIVKKFNNPVKQIYQLIRQSKNVSVSGGDIIDLKNIKEGVAGIIDRNTSYLKDIDEKNSLLMNYFYQARLKNIFLQIDEPGKNTPDSDNYAVILIKAHYRDVYYEMVSRDISKGSHNLKDLIQLYLCEFFGSAITFQIEDNQIVSIVNLKKGVETIEDAIDKTAQKLMTEDEYVYFSIVYSNVYGSSSDLHTAYQKVVEILKYRKFIDKTQIITENILDRKPEVFYFPDDQQKQFNNLLTNARKDECIQLIDRIFDQNFKNEANEFSIYLLYMKIIDCCSNALMQVFNEIPKDIPTINEGFRFGQYISIGDYKKRYRGIIAECVDFIGNNRKQNDYIVDYTKKYINENYVNDITVEILADKLKITRTYLSWYFKKKTGVNLSEYLMNCRMSKACELLQNSSLKVKDIAPKVGIPNISTFMRLFKQHTGKTPNDFRKSSLQE